MIDHLSYNSKYQNNNNKKKQNRKLASPSLASEKEWHLLIKDIFCGSGDGGKEWLVKVKGYFLLEP